MDQKEREAHRALGSMKQFEVDFEIPIKGVVQISKIIEAPTEEEAREKVKQLIDILAIDEIRRECLQEPRERRWSFRFTPSRNINIKSARDQSPKLPFGASTGALTEPDENCDSCAGSGN